MPKKKEGSNTRARIEKKWGKGVFVDDTETLNVDSISTGSFGVDEALGVGGVPRKRIVEIYGDFATGKSTLCLSIVREVQKIGQKAIYIDAEHAFNYEMANKMGVKLKGLVIQPEYGEMALDIAREYVNSGEVAAIIIDSVASLVPKAELEGEIGDSQMALQARMMSQSLRMLAGEIGKSNTCIIFVNQKREKVGIMFGNPTVTSGGKALKFYSSVRIELRHKALLKQGDSIIGNEIKAKVVKSKVSPPFRTGVFRIYYDVGLDREADILNQAINNNIVEKSGAWLNYKDFKFHGEENARKELKEDKKLLENIKKDLFDLLGKK